MWVWVCGWGAGRGEERGEVRRRGGRGRGGEGREGGSRSAGLMGRHSQNAGAVGKETLTHAEKKRLGWGTQRTRLGRDGVLSFDACNLGMVTAKVPVVTPEGVVYDKEAIIECLIAQREDLKRKRAAWEAQQADKAAEAADAEDERRSEALAAFEAQNVAAVAGDAGVASGGGGAEGAGEGRKPPAAPSLKKAYWLPTQGPGRHKGALDEPPSHTSCPTTKKKLRMKDLTEVKFMPMPEGVSEKEGKYLDPLTRDPLTDKAQVVVLRPSGVAMLESSYERFVKPDGVYNGKKVRAKDVIKLRKGGTGFAAGGAPVEAKAHHSHGLGATNAPLRGTGASLSNFGLNYN